MVFEASISLVIRDHLVVPWCDVACCLFGCCIVCPAIVTPDRSSEVWSPESKKKLKKGIQQPLVRFKTYFGRAVIVPLPLCPWYFKGVIDVHCLYYFQIIVEGDDCIDQCYEYQKVESAVESSCKDEEL